MKIHLGTYEELKKKCDEFDLKHGEQNFGGSFFYTGDVEKDENEKLFLYLCMGQAEVVILDVENPTNSKEWLSNSPETKPTALKGWLEILPDEEFPWPDV
mgnify:FL=1